MERYINKSVKNKDMPKKKGKTIFDVKYKEEDEEYAPEEGLEDEPEEHAEKPEEFRREMEEGIREEDVYTEEGRDELTESDEIESWEEGYVEGAKGKETLTCRNCKKVIVESPIEREIEHEIHWFCSDRCAEIFKKRKSAF